MALELILAIVVFIVIVLALALLAPMRSRGPSAADGSDVAAAAPSVWFTDSGSSSHCGGADGGRCDSGGDQRQNLL